MRARLMLAAALSMSAGTFSEPASAQENNGAKPAVDFCANVVLPQLPKANLGECVGYIRTSDQGFPSHECDSLLEIFPDEFFLMFDSYSDCVRTLKKD